MSTNEFGFASFDLSLRHIMIATGRTLSWVHLMRTDSTMSWVKRNVRSFPQNSVTIVRAEKQTHSIGQHARKWISFPGVGLYVTLFFRQPQPLPHPQNMGQILSITCVEILQSLGFHAQIKWPNDLVFNEKKLGGVLTETMNLGKEWGMSIGIGINVNTTREQLDTLNIAATSLFEMSHTRWKIEWLLFHLVQRFLSNFDLLQERGFHLFREKIESVLAFSGKKVLFSEEKRSFIAICKGIDSLGRLELQHTNGQIDRVYTGTLKLLA